MIDAVKRGRLRGGHDERARLFRSGEECRIHGLGGHDDRADVGGLEVENQRYHGEKVQPAREELLRQLVELHALLAVPKANEKERCVVQCGQAKRMSTIFGSGYANVQQYRIDDTHNSLIARHLCHGLSQVHGHEIAHEPDHHEYDRGEEPTGGLINVGDLDHALRYAGRYENIRV